MKRTAILITLLLTSALASGQQVIKLWPDGAPNTNSLSGPERVMEGGRIGNISDPELLLFPAAEPNGLAVIMCPGGGYAYVVLKYRMPNGHADVPLTDAQRAISILRSRADEWGIRKVGIMGGSAGGHLAATASVHFTARTRPDFQILLYPLITFEGRVTPGGRNLLFDMYPEEEEVAYYCCEKHVTPNCPPAFIVHCEDDNTVPVRDSRIYVQALEENGVPVQFLVYPDGGHGFGFRDSFAHKQEWTSALAEWLKTR